MQEEFLGFNGAQNDFPIRSLSAAFRQQRSSASTIRGTHWQRSCWQQTIVAHYFAVVLRQKVSARVDRGTWLKSVAQDMDDDFLGSTFWG
jgi:hypothetical protein